MSAGVARRASSSNGSTPSGTTGARNGPLSALLRQTLRLDSAAARVGAAVSSTDELLRRKGELDRARAAGLVPDSDYNSRLAALQANMAAQLDSPAQVPVVASPVAAVGDADNTVCTPSSAGGTAKTPSAATAGSASGSAAAKRKREDAALSVTLGVKRPKAAPLGQPGLGGFGFVFKGKLGGRLVEVPVPEPVVGRFACEGAPACEWRTDSLAGLAGHNRSCRKALRVAAARDTAAAARDAAARAAAQHAELEQRAARERFVAHMQPIQDALREVFRHYGGRVTVKDMAAWQLERYAGPFPFDNDDLSEAMLTIALGDRSWEETRTTGMDDVAWVLRAEEIELCEPGQGRRATQSTRNAEAADAAAPGVPRAAGAAAGDCAAEADGGEDGAAWDADSKEDGAVDGGAGRGNDASAWEEEDDIAARRRQRRASGIDGRSTNRGSRRRLVHTNAFKAEVLQACEEDDGARQSDIAERFGITQSLVSAWKKNSNAIYGAAADDVLRGMRQVKLGGQKARWMEMEAELIANIRELRKRGRKIGRRYVATKAKQIFGQMNPDAAPDAFKASPTWRHRFLRRHNLVRRKRSNKKQLSLAELLPVVQEWHGQLAAMVSAPAPAPALDAVNPAPALDGKWGRFPPERRSNVDEVPLEYVADDMHTYEVKGIKHVHVSQQSEALSKRQATLLLCFSALGPLPNLGLIFRGTGKRVSKVEQAALAAAAPNVDVYWQPKAWSDRPVMLDWQKRTWKPFTEKHYPEGETLLLLDGLDSHTHIETRRAIKKRGTLCWYGPAGRTHLWQPVDAGAGALLKFLYNECQDEWLDTEENLERWNGTMTASERRIMMATWSGQAWTKFQTDVYSQARRRYFEKTGCLMTADGSDDVKITPEGTHALGGYTFTRLPPATAEGDNCSDGEDDAEPPVPDPSDSDPDSDDAADSEDDVAAAPIAFGAALSTEFCPTGFELACDPYRPAVERTALIGKSVAFRCAHSGWGIFVIRTYAQTANANFVLRDRAGADLRAFLAAPAYAVGADGSAAVMDALKPNSWVLLKLRRIGAGPAPAAGAGPAFVPLGRSAAAAMAVAAVAAATAAAEVAAAARPRLDAMVAEELRRIGDVL